MPNNKETEVIINKLRNVFDLICDEARQNSVFCEQLAAIFLSGEVFPPIEKGPKKPPREPVLNIVEVMHSSGESQLLNKLEQLTNDQLARLAADEGVKKLKEAKATERTELVSLLVDTARKRLNQGGSFTK